MNNILGLTIRFLKLAQSEGPDERLQAYEFMSFLNTLANIKNQLHKVRELHSIFSMVFDILVRLRPGIIKNAIKDMIQSGAFDSETYVDLKNSMLKDIETNDLSNILNELIQIIDIELLSDEDLAKSQNGIIMVSIRESAKKAIRTITVGLQYR